MIPLAITSYGSSLLWQFKTVLCVFSGLEFRFYPLVSMSLSGSTKIAHQSWGLSMRLASGQYTSHKDILGGCGVGMFPEWSRQACSDWHLSAGSFSSLCRCSRKIRSPGSSLLFVS